MRRATMSHFEPLLHGMARNLRTLEGDWVLNKVPDFPISSAAAGSGYVLELRVV